MIIPTHLQIEPLNGLCTARCTMCSYASWTRKPYRMTEEEFERILTKFLPYREQLQYLSLQGWGETLLDKGIVEKVQIAKRMGFQGVGFATNCTELERYAMQLLYFGLDTLICSIDGATAKTHESIRVGTNFRKIVENIHRVINLRLIYGYTTKILIRFIRQKANAHEWEAFKAYWEQQINPACGDAVISFDVVDCDGKIKDYEGKDVLGGVGVPMICDQINQRMIILSNGDVSLCCGDDNGKFNIGNVFTDDPIELYNGPVFTYYRAMMAQGRIGELDICRGCTIPRSEERKDRA